MARTVHRAVVAGGGLLLLATTLTAQGYQLRLDSRFSSVSYRGYSAQTIPAADVVTQPDGRLTTPDGITVRCPAGATTCTYVEPGAELTGSPLVSTVDAAVWGFGVSGLKLRTKARVGADLQDPDVWPGQAPAVQLLEGYVEYANRLVTVQAGRTYEFSRLGFTGVDGGKLDLRPFGGHLRLSAYGGWGLARGAPLPLSSPEVNPLNQFQPDDRQLVAGGSLGWAFSGFEGRVLYQREVDPRGDLETILASERGAIDAALRPMRGVTLAGGAEYDLARGELGTADARLTLAARSGRAQLSLGGKHYRPYFDLWTIWGVFDPAPYTGGFGSARITPIAGVELWTRGEFFSYDDTAADTVLVKVADDGWRWSFGATIARLRSWTFDAGYHVDKGPGASSLGFDGRVMFHPGDVFFLSTDAGYLSRPLEFRFNDTKLFHLGFRAGLEPRPGVRIHAGGRYYDEVRERADAAELDWNQFRIDFGLTLTFRSGAETPSIHPAILRIPERGEQ
ncbi:MAG: hypothetical protein PVF27_05630 [Gemmatimonadales bacterium]|jgi:hypothetical protein